MIEQQADLQDSTTSTALDNQVDNFCPEGRSRRNSNLSITPKRHTSAKPKLAESEWPWLDRLLHGLIIHYSSVAQGQKPLNQTDFAKARATIIKKFVAMQQSQDTDLKERS